MYVLMICIPKAAFCIPSEAERAMILGLAIFWGKLDIWHRDTQNINEKILNQLLYFTPLTTYHKSKMIPTGFKYTKMSQFESWNNNFDSVRMEF